MTPIEEARFNSVRNIIVDFLSEGANERYDENLILPQSRFVEDLGCDSLDCLEILMWIEDAFNVEFSDEEAEQCKTVEQAAILLQATLNKKSA